MAAPRPIHEENKDLYKNPQSRFAPTTTGTWGVQNAQIEKYTKGGGKRMFAANTNRVPQSNQQPLPPTQPTANPQREELVSADNRRNKSRGTVRFIKAFLRKKAIQARATPVVFTIAVWYWPWYIFELILAVFARVSFAIAGWLYSVTDPITIAALMQSWGGLGAATFFYVFLGLSAFIFIARILQIVIATAEFKIILLHPWFGEGAGFKICSLMVTLIGSFIPLLQTFPLFWIWIIAVLMNPK